MLAGMIDKMVPQKLMDMFIVEMTATGGIILGIGLKIAVRMEIYCLLSEGRQFSSR